MDRLFQLSSQVTPNQTAQFKYGTSNIPPKNSNDVVICCAVRTPLTKAKRGPLKDTAPELLLQTAFQGLIKKINLDPTSIRDIVVGNVNQPGSGAMTSKMAAFLSGFPEETALSVTNRFCASGLEACAIIAAKIKFGILDCGIAAGVEQMTMFDMQTSMNPELISDAVFQHPSARDCLMSMGETSENVAEQFGVTREQQDRFAVESQLKAAKAQKEGLFDEEIVPIKVKVKKGDKFEEVIVSKDDGIRGDTTYESLAKLKPAFKKNGTTTAGNASQVTDGAAVVLLARRSYAFKMGWPILARFIDYSVAGVPPHLMGIGPSAAIPVLLEKAGLTKDQIDIYEINEAFASQSVYCIQKLGLDVKKVNPKGGAIAFGHPLGCTGARQVCTLLPELKRQKAKYGVISMCTATGMGAAALIENEQA